MIAVAALLVAACEKAPPPAPPGAIDPAPSTTPSLADSGTPQVIAPRVTPVDADDVAALAGRHLSMPVQGMRADQLMPSFSQVRGTRPHEAIDILAPRGTPIVAVEDGKIAKLFTSEAGGLTVYQFDPASRYAYYYAHLDRYEEGLADGQSLRRGQVIGYVGSTGNADPKAPHLHFAIFRLGAERRWWQGTAIDPYPVFTKRLSLYGEPLSLSTGGRARLARTRSLEGRDHAHQ
jgi:peptidoglycan LD-endopeptidase LytH